MLKMLGKVLVDNSYFYASTEAVEQYLQDHGIDTYGLHRTMGGLSEKLCFSKILHKFLHL